MKRTMILAMAVLCLCTANPVSLFAQRKITIKMASPVPEGTPWGKYLNQIAGEWEKITGGEVELKIYHNGIAGSEEAVLRNLKLNQLQAAVLSTFGLSAVAPEILTLSCPFLIRDDEELDLVLERLKPELEERINGQGFFTLAWARVGWVKVFSKQPVFVPADLKRQKLATNTEEMKLNQAFKAMGFQMVPVARNDILIALNGGMAEAVYESPIAVGGLQIFGIAKNMASINIAPFMGGIVLSRNSWRSIPDRYKPRLLEATRRIEKELDASVRDLEANMIATMAQYGLRVNELSEAQKNQWYNDVGQAMPGLAGTVFDRDLYRRIETILAAHRARER
ncbi:MAG: TRAP transporter substrate-binding protein DctP [Treponema sp.]|jgi:TRAP-type C4-dicarboxylate transport system substrate-binding protein|nr:TRAP transporter substrate-binding protein DctP [Treponema sp.]